jgi:polyhydroxybutyrate depolymerase
MNSLYRITVSLFLITILNACDKSEGSPHTDAELLNQRPFELNVPANYDDSTPTPLVVVLHGLGGNGEQIVSYWGLEAAAERHGFLLAYPEGTRDSFGRKHWYGTDACCTTDFNLPDDVRYLSVVLDDIEARFNVDGRQVFFVGHSNGGFMSHRMACDRSSRVAAIVLLAGTSWKDPDHCKALEPVHVLQVHGDLDRGILFDGGIRQGVAYPSAIDTVSDWATINGCTGSFVDISPNLDIDTSIADSETRVQNFADCPPGGEAELWTILGGGHAPYFDDNWVDLMWGFLSSHQKPLVRTEGRNGF